ncbi:MAG: DUF805 domain-containing protein [Pseudomonadota bacterium]
MNHYIDAIKNYVNFSGRATRTQFWMFILFNIIISIVLNLIDVMLGTLFLGFIYSLFVLLPALAVGARRLHDTGRSGWWQLIYLIPLIGLIVMIVFCVQDSVEDNDYGPNPKGG